MKYRRIMRLVGGGVTCVFLGVFVVPGNVFLLGMGVMLWGFAFIEMCDPWR